MTVLIVKLPSDTLIVKMDPMVAGWILSHGAQWPEAAGRLPGTKAVLGEHLVLADLNATLAEVEAAISAFSLPWTVLGAKEPNGAMIRTPSSTDLLPFMNDEPVYDLNGDIISWVPPLTIPKLANIAGHSDWDVS